MEEVIHYAVTASRFLRFAHASKTRVKAIREAIPEQPKVRRIFMDII
jgi:hypothetical protein